MSTRRSVLSLMFGPGPRPGVTGLRAGRRRGRRVAAWCSGRWSPRALRWPSRRWRRAGPGPRRRLRGGSHRARPQRPRRNSRRPDPGPRAHRVPCHLRAARLADPLLRRAVRGVKLRSGSGFEVLGTEFPGARSECGGPREAAADCFCFGIKILESSNPEPAPANVPPRSPSPDDGRHLGHQLLVGEGGDARLPRARVQCLPPSHRIEHLP